MGELEYYAIMAFMILFGLLGISTIVYVEVNDRKAEKQNQLNTI
ncbi:MAG: hypothetical protein ACKVOU_03180 [Cytophagales bacterium]